jgi:pilus assembly protein CpaF
MELGTLLQFFPSDVRGLFLDTQLTDLMINEDGRVFIERYGRLSAAPCAPVDQPALIMAVQNVARLLGSDIDEQRPILDTRLPGGSRIAAVYANKALTVTIRKFNAWYTAAQLEANGTLPSAVYDLIIPALVRDKANLLISGGTGSGKSTLTKALLDHIPDSERLIVIESPRELRIEQPNAVRWEASEGVPGGAAPVSVAQLVIAALRHRPDRIIVGEVREPAAAYQFLQALNTGHSGSISTIHADSAADAFHRLVDLTLASHANLSAEFVQKQVFRSIDYIVHVARQEGQRRVTEVAAVKGGEGAVRLVYSRAKEKAQCHS